MRPGPMKDYLNMFEVDDDGCWLWTGAVASNGYGKCRGNGAHRYVFERLVGPIPSGKQLDHICHDPDVCPGGTCKHRRCVNPAHLRPVAPRENVLRSRSFVAIYAQATHCPEGHPYSGSNLVILPKQRTCRACARRRWTEEHARERMRVSDPTCLNQSERAVLNAVAAGSVGNASIAAQSGVSRQHVSVIIGRLSRGRLVAQSGSFVSANGRRKYPSYCATDSGRKAIEWEAVA